LTSRSRRRRVRAADASFLPVAVWEMVIAVWLLVKGFSPGTAGTEVRTVSVATTRDHVREAVQSGA
jgi:hypothetical protein